MFDYKLIEALAMVVKEGGFDKAAKKLNFTQSAISQRIKLLEEQTGQIFLVRTTPPKATLAGKKMIKHYMQVKRLEDDLIADYTPPDKKDFASLPIGVNEDSLAIWFFNGVREFLEKELVVLDIRVDDQEQTHRLLKDGKVVGCISSRDKPIQACRMEYLGRMNYRLMASPEFAARWFPEGLCLEAVKKAPALIFNRKDELHNKLFMGALKEIPEYVPAHYLPSTERFLDFVISGLAYGMFPDQHSVPLMKNGTLINLAPSCHISVKLYWHCWNIKSRLLERFTRHLIKKARILLAK